MGINAEIILALMGLEAVTIIWLIADHVYLSSQVKRLNNDNINLRTKLDQHLSYDLDYYYDKDTMQYRHYSIPETEREDWHD